MSLDLPYMATYADYGVLPPTQETAGGRTWITRGAHFVVGLSELDSGAEVHRHHRDESFVLVARGSVGIQAGLHQVEAAAETLSITPPGTQRLVARTPSLVAWICTAREQEWAALASNAALYAKGIPSAVAAAVPWPMPVGGFRLRHYVLAEHTRTGSVMRPFRSCTLMVNPLVKRAVPRDSRQLDPHVHTDFEQGSLVLQGTYKHHLRYPWPPNLQDWRDDEHVSIGAPSLTVIPAGAIHTSHNVGHEPGWMVDIFGPPRRDFSLQPGMVCNESEYPLPE
ncbi:cupin domain-containing protein [Ottowia thiooxydans]|uniref:Mannose-6-phosphate isomerase-like protein (Cupin superfamily) n=1 Tax=Ottowia thiooxydans TaxID=219182 RepID=A0ABV2Q9C7_9BURK